MAVQFILGRSGTGKTSYCVRAIADALQEPSEQPLLFLVPEQATYQSERAILSDARIAGYHRLHILSFDRLQFMLLGRHTARPAISRIGRQMVVHKILRDNLDKLHIFGSSALMPGFAREMAATITELHQWARSPGDIEALLEYLGEGRGGRPSCLPESSGTDVQRMQGSHEGLPLPSPDSHRLSALKFADIGLVFRQYAAAIRDKFIDPDAQITTACRAVAKSDIIKGARLWVDGFASFTGGEMALLIEVLKVVDQACMALCVDPAEVGIVGGNASTARARDHRQAALDEATRGAPGPRVGLFEPTVRTYRDMLERLGEAKVSVSKPLLLGQVPRFNDCPALAHVERNIFRLGAGKVKAGGDVRLIAAPSLRVEVQIVARQILALVREQGYRYCDIAVVASDLSHYEQYVRAYFEDYGIPFFIDQRKPLNQHPVVELVCAALQAVTGGLTRSEVFAWLKTDLVCVGSPDIGTQRSGSRPSWPRRAEGVPPLDRGQDVRDTSHCQAVQGDLQCETASWRTRDALATLENYCLAFGIEGRDWLSGEPWRFKDPGDEDFDEDEIDRIRREATGPLLELREALCPGGDLQKRLTAGEFTRIIFAFLDRLHVRRTVGQWIDEAHQSGDLTTADEHRQFFDTFVDIFDSLAETFDRQEMTAQDYFGLLASAFSQMTLAFIPPTLDQVLIGSIERSRHPNLKAIFLLGATQRQFPIPLASSGVLTDEDRDAAEAARFEIAPSSTQSLVDRQYLAYIAFTRPSKFMCISYPCVDEKGSAIMRSHFIDELQSLFEDVREEHVTDDLLTLREVQNRDELGELLCSRLGRDVFLPADDSFAGLLRAMQSDRDYAPMAASIVAALGYDNRACLAPGVANELFGRFVRGSATRLGMFAACPYKHFARYALELKPRREFKLEPLDLGLFYHRALDALHKRLVAEGESFTGAAQDRLVGLLHEEIERLTQKDAFLSTFIRRSSHNAFVIDSAARTLEECVLGIGRMARAGSFRPFLSEVAFGRPPQAGAGLGRFELPMPDGRVLALDGKIDRLDVAEIDGRKAALIIDYKRTRSGAAFDWGGFYHGLDVQLAIYMLAVHHCGAGVADEVAGALYMPIETTPQSATLAELAEEETDSKFAYKARGIINSAYCRHLDANADKNSLYYNFYVKKDGDPCGMYARSNALTPLHFARLLDWSREHILRLAVDIVSGRIECRPYHRGSERGCTWCDFLSVCHFDWQINDYNFLRSAGKTDLIARLENA